MHNRRVDGGDGGDGDERGGETVIGRDMALWQTPLFRAYCGHIDDGCKLSADDAIIHS